MYLFELMMLLDVFGVIIIRCNLMHVKSSVILELVFFQFTVSGSVSYTHLTLPTIYSV